MLSNLHPFSRSRFGPLSLVLVLVLMASRAGNAQQDPESEANVIQFQLDSLKREVSKRILSDVDKKEIRSCDRDKAQFLKQCRVLETEYPEVEKRLNEAKLGNGDPNSPAIQSLMEKKFILEKTCDDRFSADPRGKQCQSGEKKREVELNKALTKDSQYQKLLKKSQTKPSEHL